MATMTTPKLYNRPIINEEYFKLIDEINIDGHLYKLGDRVNIEKNDNGEPWFTPWGFDCGFIDYIMVSKTKSPSNPNQPLTVSVKVRTDEHTVSHDNHWLAKTGLFGIDNNSKYGYTITPYKP